MAITVIISLNLKRRKLCSILHRIKNMKALDMEVVTVNVVSIVENHLGLQIQEDQGSHLAQRSKLHYQLLSRTKQRQ